ncbi:hypothetical protein J2S53_003138 [Actinopolyspora lacussalsi]|nr:hypothetical protein [Actinopolyspora lacussalsi]
MTDQWYTGNAADDGDERCCWILGNSIAVTIRWPSLPS